MIDSCENTLTDEIRELESELAAIEGQRAAAYSQKREAENEASTLESTTKPQRQALATKIAELRQQGFDTDPEVAAAKKEFFDFKARTDFYAKIEQLEKEIAHLHQQRGRAVLLEKDVGGISKKILETENSLASLVDGIAQRKEMIGERASELYQVMRNRWNYWKLDGQPPQLTAFYFD